MNWLIISSDDEQKSIVKENLNKLFPESIIYESSAKLSDLRSVYDILDSISYCILLSDKIKAGCELIVGFLCGNKIPVITTANIVDEVLNCFETLTYKPDVNEICSLLKKNKKKIESDIRRKEAYDYLFEHGIPFSPDHFSKYIEKGNLEICECYLTAGMDVNSRDVDGTPMLNIAVRNENIEIVKWLLDNGADVKVISEDRGYSPLMDAVWRGNKEITSLLVEKGSDINILSKDGQTMIILAVGANNIEICKILCENGADVDIADTMGMSAYGYAKLFKKEKILSILEQYHKES